MSIENYHLNFLFQCSEKDDFHASASILVILLRRTFATQKVLENVLSVLLFFVSSRKSFH